MAYRTLEAVLHPDSHLALPSVELPSHPIRVMVTMLEDDQLSVRKPARMRSPRLVHPEQAVNFVKEVIEVTDDARV